MWTRRPRRARPPPHEHRPRPLPSFRRARWPSCWPRSTRLCRPNTCPPASSRAACGSPPRRSQRHPSPCARGPPPPLPLPPLPLPPPPLPPLPPLPQPTALRRRSRVSPARSDPHPFLLHARPLLLLPTTQRRRPRSPSTRPHPHRHPRSHSRLCSKKAFLDRPCRPRRALPLPLLLLPPQPHRECWWRCSQPTSIVPPPPPRSRLRRSLPPPRR